MNDKKLSSNLPGTELEGIFVPQTNCPEYYGFLSTQTVSKKSIIMKISLFPEKLHLINTVTYCESNVYNEKKFLRSNYLEDGHKLDIILK